MSDRMTDDVYHLAQGPLHLSRKRREEKADKAPNKSGESINRELGIKKRGIFCSVKVWASSHRFCSFSMLLLLHIDHQKRPHTTQSESMKFGLTKRVNKGK